MYKVARFDLRNLQKLQKLRIELRSSYKQLRKLQKLRIGDFPIECAVVQPPKPQKTKTTQQPKGHCSMRPTIQKTNKTQKQQNKNKNLFQSDLYNQTIT